MPSACALRVIISANVGFVAADRLGDRHGDVVGRTRDDRLDRVLDRDRVAGARPELGRLLRGGVLGDRDLRSQGQRALVELLEQQVERHHLGDRRGMARRVLVDAVERAAGIGVDDDRREGGVGGRVAGVMDVVMVVTPPRASAGAVSAPTSASVAQAPSANLKNREPGDWKPTQRHCRPVELTRRISLGGPGPLRDAHCRKGYADAVTAGLTRRRLPDPSRLLILIGN